MLTLNAGYLFLGYNYSSITKALCGLADLHICWRHLNCLKPLPESKHILPTGKGCFESMLLLNRKLKTTRESKKKGKAKVKLCFFLWCIPQTADNNASQMEFLHSGGHFLEQDITVIANIHLVLAEGTGLSYFS